MKCVIGIQARMGSARFPGKVLAKIGDRTVIEHVYERCASVGKAFVLIPDSGDNTPLRQLCWDRQMNLYMHRGDENDVLSRYVGFAFQHSPDVIVRVTGDCPMIDPVGIQQVVGALVLSGTEYATNVGEPRETPDGFDVEAFTFAALMKAAVGATSPEDREHVTPWMRRNLRCRVVHTHGTERGHERITLDTPDDLEALRGALCPA